MAREAALVLEDGFVALGEPFGANLPVAAEVVFNTGMTGYQEILTDPSYRGQMVVMTHPQIGNYGIARSGNESARPWAAAFIVRELAAEPHHWEAQETLQGFMERWGVPGIQGVDTRAIVRRLREEGTLRGVLRQSGPDGFSPEDLEALRRAALEAPSVSNLDLVEETSGAVPPDATDDGGQIAVLDCGLKWNIVRSLVERGVTPRVFPWNTPASEILAAKPRGIVISNGPGDPRQLPQVVEELKTLVQSSIPLMGICLGHQLLGLAAGATTSRLRYGHHGGNHPVRDLGSGRVTITTQNHEFQVDRGSLPADSGFEVSHENLNDNSVEGLRHRTLPVFSVQYHPEGCPGPQDSQPLFDELFRLSGVPFHPLPKGESHS